MASQVLLGALPYVFSSLLFSLVGLGWWRILKQAETLSTGSHVMKNKAKVLLGANLVYIVLMCVLFIAWAATNSSGRGRPSPGAADIAAAGLGIASVVAIGMSLAFLCIGKKLLGLLGNKNAQMQKIRKKVNLSVGIFVACFGLEGIAQLCSTIIGSTAAEDDSVYDAIAAFRVM